MMERTNTHESQYASSLIEASLDPLITINPAGKITDMNVAFIKITGSTRKKITGTDFGIYFTDPKKARKIYQEVFDKGFVTNYPLVVIDGSLTDVLFNGSVYRDTYGKIIGAVVVARDITEQKQNEKELIEAKTFAEQSTKIAEEAKNRAELATHLAEDAVKSKQQFLSNMSHEIRTPMNAIIGFTKVVLKTNLTVKQKEYLTAIKISGDALIVLINDILDLAKVDAGKMTFEQIPFKMATSISSMVHLFETKIQEKNLELITEYDKNIPEVLVGDPIRLNQIILNLVSNAVKFTNKGKIIVRVKMLKENSDNVTIEFSIIDSGIGIEKNKIKDIFENFHQASHVTSRLYGGTGLGLAIVKQLVEPQGGSIRVESEINKGSTFSFILNFQKSELNQAIEIRESEYTNEVKHVSVLVVEDITLNQLLMKTILDDFGFEWDIADNGKIAIEKLKVKKYDIILMDLQMPEMSGYEATEYIRNKMKSNIPIIALTADVTTIDLEKSKAVGMNEYITKPINEELLYKAIISSLKKPEKSITREKNKKFKYINLNYLSQRTRSNPKLIKEMISVYLEQTPPLIKIIKNSIKTGDWEALHSAIHKMIPSFTIMGFHADFEATAKKIQAYSQKQEELEDIHKLVLELENTCELAFKELEEELNRIK